MKKVKNRKKDQLRVTSFIAECNVHETEIMDKVKYAIGYLLPQNNQIDVDSVLIKEKMEGHYHNTIWRMKLQVKKKQAQETFFYLLKRVISGEKEKILEEFDRRFDTKALELYLRLNKQKLAQNEIWLTNGLDSVKICVKVGGFSGPDRIISASQFLKECFRK